MTNDPHNFIVDRGTFGLLGLYSFTAPELVFRTVEQRIITRVHWYRDRTRRVYIIITPHNIKIPALVATAAVRLERQTKML